MIKVEQLAKEPSFGEVSKMDTFNLNEDYITVDTNVEGVKDYIVSLDMAIYKSKTLMNLGRSVLKTNRLKIA